MLLKGRLSFKALNEVLVLSTSIFKSNKDIERILPR